MRMKMKMITQIYLFLIMEIEDTVKNVLVNSE